MIDTSNTNHFTTEYLMGFTYFEWEELSFSFFNIDKMDKKKLNTLTLSYILYFPRISIENEIDQLKTC